MFDLVMSQYIFVPFFVECELGFISVFDNAESMWKLGLGGSGESGESYPERPNEADCIYYLKTGYCGYGSRCRFNHPRDRGKVFITTLALGLIYS